MHSQHEVKGKRLFVTILLNLIITMAQVAGGLISNSLSLLSDALHNFSDVLALFIAYLANGLSSYPNTKERTFGYKRAEILAAFFNASILVGVALFLIIEAINKFFHPEKINSVWVVALGILSIVLNSISVLLIKKESKHSVNIKAAYLHLLTDVLTSVAVAAGGALMYFYNIFWIDPLVSSAIAIYLIVASLGLIRETLNILMDFTPKKINIEDMIKTAKELQEIDNIHHIHVWKLDEHSILLEAHLDFKQNITIEESNKTIYKLEKMFLERFSITHSTLQCEFDRKDKKDVIV